MRRLGLLVMVLAALAFLSPTVHAAEAKPKNRGLFLTPVREYVTITAGQQATRALTIANITDAPAHITLSVEQFTVEDFTYDYLFKPSKKDWVKLGATELELQPNKSQKIPYTVVVPPGAAPGGYYFTVFATQMLNGGARKVRVGEALYVTVSGQLRLSSHIQKETIPWVSFGGDIPYEFDIKSTGNVHFFTYVSGKLQGVGSSTNGEEKAHLLLPATTRTVSGTIPSPLLPGVYQAIYGYRVDDGQNITKTKYIAYAPLWFLVLLVGLVVLGIAFWRRRLRRASHKKLY